MSSIDPLKSERQEAIKSLFISAYQTRGSFPALHFLNVAALLAVLLRDINNGHLRYRDPRDATKEDLRNDFIVLYLDEEEEKELANIYISVPTSIISEEKLWELNFAIGTDLRNFLKSPKKEFGVEMPPWMKRQQFSSGILRSFDMKFNAREFELQEWVQNKAAVALDMETAGSEAVIAEIFSILKKVSCESSKTTSEKTKRCSA